MPLLEPLLKVLGNDVSSHAGKSDRALTPLLKSEIEFVIFNPPYAVNIFLLKHQHSHST